MIHLLPGPGGLRAAGRRPRPSTLVALGLFVLVTLLMAWPVTRHPAVTVPGDYGDPLFVMWAMGWVMRQLTAFATGHVEALDGLWHANIFYPEPNTLALSEHFVAESVQVLPVYWLTHNPILCYNLALLSSFVLTGLGTFLLARDLWGRVAAALAAGVFAAFNEYRLVAEIGHLQVLSIHWLPFALLGLHRFIAFGTRGALWGAGLAIVALGLSSGSFMAYCAPFIVVFAFVELARSGRLLRWNIWAGLAVMAVCVALVTTPFVLPYIAVQRRLGFTQSIDDVVQGSATLDQYGAALGGLVIPLLLAIVALAAFRRSPHDAVVGDRHAPDGETPIVVQGSRNPGRQRVMIGVLIAFLVLACWLSLGPVVRAGGEAMGIPGLYGLLYSSVAGFSGLHVPARFGALVLVFLALVAGAGAAVVERRIGLAGRLLVVILTCVFLWQAWPARFPVNGVLASAGLAPPPAYLTPSPTLPPIYRALQSVDRNAIVAELPFGDPWYDLRYMFFSVTHERRLLNGHSGIVPPSYLARRRALAAPLDDPRRALEALGPATHVIVHDMAWRDDTGRKVVALLESAGGLVIADQDGAQLLALKPMTRDARARVAGGS